MTDDAKKQRKFSNIKLTEKHHFHQMGLWIMITVPLVILLNYLLFAFFMLKFGNASGTAGISPEFQLRVAAGLLVEMLIICIALLMMAKTTSHRISGVFISMKNTFDKVASGNLKTRQHFRDYDKLEDLEASINTMLDTICEGKDSTGE